MDYAQFFITSLVFSGFGYYVAIGAAKKEMVAATIESLIDSGFLKTRGSGDNVELVRFDQE